MFKRILMTVFVMVLALAPNIAPAQDSYNVVDLDQPIAASMPDSDYTEYARAVRRYVHSHPETRWQEENTLAAIVGEVTWLYQHAAVDYDLSMQMHRGGFVVDMIVDEGFELALFRADVDALPVTEETGLPYSSLNDNAMHACGHDFHVAQLLAAFREFTYGRVVPTHNLRFVFQRAEENPIDQSGGHSLVYEANVTEGVDRTYALHVLVDETVPPGTFISDAGPIFANNDQFVVRIREASIPESIAGAQGDTMLTIKVQAEGGHVAWPNVGSNPVDVITDLQFALQRFENPLFPVWVRAGVSNQANVRSRTGELVYWYMQMAGTTQADLDRLVGSVQEVASGVEAMYPDDVRIEVSMRPFDGDIDLGRWAENALPVARSLHLALRGLDRRSMGPIEPAAITPAVYISGDHEIEIWYSARTFLDEAGRTALEKRIGQVVDGVELVHNGEASADYEFVRGYPVTVNDPEVYASSRAVLEAASYDASGTLKELGSEDMSYYQLQVPGVYWMLSVWQEGSGNHHASTFNPTEDYIGDGVRFWLLMATQ